jgi:hypothetical protein
MYTYTYMTKKTDRVADRNKDRDTDKDTARSQTETTDIDG